MKKILLCLITLLITTGCSSQNNDNNIENVNINNEEVTNTDNTQKEEIIDTYTDDNPITLSFYKYNGMWKDRTKINEYTSSCIGIADIGSFEVFLTDKESIDGDYFQNTWKKYYDEYSDINNYRFGFHIKFSLNDGTVFDKLILEPDDGDEFYSYIQIYVYDDVHKNIGQWYSHVTQEEFNNDTLLSSIKLTASSNWDMIESPIEITVFSYDSEDDFKDNKYRGNSFYKINIQCTK